MNRELNISYEILKKVCLEKSYVSIELNKHIAKIENVNTSLITKIVYGVLEKDITLEYFISQYVTKQPNAEILILLKIVAYVSKTINSIPPFALVNEIVNIAKKIDKHQSGFVNAVSKKLINNSIILPSKKDYIKYLSVKFNYPEWIIKELMNKHSREFVEDLVSKELTTLTHIRINTSLISVEEFKQKLQSLDISYQESFYDYTLYVDYAKLLKTDMKSYYVVQGLPSIITCNVLGATRGLVLDVCSAPGGKAVYLATNKNLEIFACDIHNHRVDLIKKYAKSQGVDNVKCFLQDGTIKNTDWIEKFDFVMCDVPCSNLGVSRKKPDVFLNKSIADVKTLAGIQYKILENSANYVKSGGILQYSTCTILDYENRDVVNKFLKNHKEFELVPIDFEGINITNEDNMYTFYPNLTNTEGFVIGRMRRK